MIQTKAASPSASQASTWPSALPARASLGASAPALLSKAKLHELIKHVDPNEQLDEDVEDVLLQSLDKFVEDLASDACDMAKHRKGRQLEVQDVEMVLEHKSNAWMPGYMNGEDYCPRKSSVTEAHKQRLAVIRKVLKK